LSGEDHRWFKRSTRKTRPVMMMMIIIIIFRKYVSSIPGNHEARELKKTAILGTAHILRKVLTYT
jgi:hypothetical protein